MGSFRKKPNDVVLSLVEFAEAYLMLTHREGMSTNGVTFRDRLNYMLDQDSASPGKNLLQLTRTGVIAMNLDVYRLHHACTS